jgi:predicted DNA-binding transcriptional regulator AlpA
MPKGASLLMRIPEASEVSGLNRRRLYELASRPGLLPEGLVVRLGRTIYISRSRLEEWLGKSQSAG